MTVKEHVLRLLKGGKVMTATQAGTECGRKWSTTSSIMKKMFDKGVLDRIPNYGPLGGYGYFLARERKLVGRVSPVNEEVYVSGRIEPSGDEEERFCETCGARMVVPGKSATTECSRCLEF